MRRLLPALLVLCLAASYALTLTPGDDVTITGCTTLLKLAGNVVSCATESATPTRTAMASATRTATATNTATSTPTATATSGGVTNLTAQVGASSDDANQDGSTLALTGTIWLGTGSSTASSYTGLRFAGLAVPRGAAITSAHLEVNASQTAWVGMAFAIRAEASGNSPAFSTGNLLSARALTTASVAHSSDAQWNSGTWYSLNEMAPVVQEVVNRADWQSGNALSIILKGSGVTWARKWAASYDSAPANAPRLVLVFAGGGPANTPTNTPTPTATAAGATATPTPTFLPTTPANPLAGVAILGDSVHDEYRADDARGTSYAANTFNWAELLVRYRAVPVGVWGTRAEPRRSGYEFNWARSGATSADMAGNQLAGARAQLQSGAARYAIVQVGTNDLNGIAAQVCAGSNIQGTLNAIASNINSTAQQLNAVAPGRVLVAGVQDAYTSRLSPPAETAAWCADPNGNARFVAAVANINAQLATFAQANGIAWWEYNADLQAALSPRRTADNFLTVGGQRIDCTTRGNEPHHCLLADQYFHVGTVVSGLVSNLYIAQLNSRFGAGLTLFTDAEILNAAGVH